MGGGSLSTQRRPPILRFWLMSFCTDPEKCYLGDVSQIGEFQKRVAFGRLFSGPLFAPQNKSEVRVSSAKRKGKSTSCELRERGF